MSGSTTNGPEPGLPAGHAPNEAIMEWLLDALRVLREVRDWSDSRRRSDQGAAKTRKAISEATASFEGMAAEQGVDVPKAARVERWAPGAVLVAPIGPEQPARAEPEEVEGDALTTTDERIRSDDIDPQAVSAIKRLRRYGYRGYLVGGCVRDLLLGIAPKDFDIATDARPEEVKAVFRNSRIIGRRFRLVHLYYRGGKVLEVATFRAAVPAEEEDENGQGDLLIRRDNVFGSEQEDARRRDFTINALFYDPEHGRIIDHVGGLADIDAKVVRMIGDPDIRLREDPVRILRAMRFRAKAGLTIEPELKAALGRHVEDLVRCPPARLLEETLKMLRMGHAERAFDEMYTHGVVDVLLPELQSFLAGHFSMLAGSESSEDGHPLEEVRSHLRALDEVVAEGPVSDDVVLGVLFYPMAEAVMAEADENGRDRNKRLAELLAAVGTRVQLTRKIAETLRQSWSVQRHFAPEPQGSRRRRRMSPATLIRRSFFGSALKMYEVHLRAIDGDLEDIEVWKTKAREEGVSVREGEGEDGDGREGGEPRRRRRRGGRRRKRAAAPN